MQRYRCFFRTLTTKLMWLVVVILSLAACTTAPVQEMSDARQAIRSAEEAGAAQRPSDALSAAQRLLRAAQTYLEAGAYDDARRFASDARDEAIKAREEAVRNTTIQVISP
jgi:hypothetical protein